MQRNKQTWRRLAILLAGLGLLMWGLTSTAAPVTSGFFLYYEEITSGLVQPTALTHAFDDRLFVAERAGLIRLVRGDGTLVPTAFLDLRGQVDADTYIEMGLLGLVFHPDYVNNGYFFVNYTDLNGDSQISRYQVSANPDVADPSTALPILTIPQPTVIHNGGQMAFGPDGYLYVGVGDGGWLSDPDNNAQNMGLLLGKMLRIDVSLTDTPPAYTVPADNPFVGDAGAADEIWASGFRNPWRFGFDRATGDLFVSDVGNFAYEEVNFQPAGSSGGENYGWRCYEGNAEFNLAGCGSASNYTFPIHDYVQEPECAVIGGYVYRGTAFPEMQGHYLFTDFCTGRMRSLIPDGNEWTIFNHESAPALLSTFGEGSDGELYVIGYIDGTIYHLTSAPVLGTSIMPLAMVPNPSTPTPTPLPNPDLVIQDVTIVPVSPSAGQPIQVFITVQNQGNQNVPSGNNFFIDFYINRLPAPFLIGDLSWGAQGSDYGIGQGETYTGEFFLPAGNHQLYVQVDTDNTVTEQNETNNIFGPINLTITP